MEVIKRVLYSLPKRSVKVKVNYARWYTTSLIATNTSWKKANKAYLMGFGLIPFFTVNALPEQNTKDLVNTNPKKPKPEPVLRNRKDLELLKDIKLADRVYEVDEAISYNDIYVKLSKHKEKGEPELLWRLARVTYELSKTAKSAEQLKLVNEAFETIQKALELDNTNFAVHKWMAILLNAKSTLVGIKEQITQSYNVRKHMEKAMELNPEDATSIYLLGNWCYSVAEVPWYQKKIASTIFAEPPSCSFAEAVSYFLKAEDTEPQFYSMNLLLLAKSYLKLGDLDKAHAHLLKLKDMPMTTAEDYEARKEGKELLDKIMESKK